MQVCPLLTECSSNSSEIEHSSYGDRVAQFHAEAYTTFNVHTFHVLSRCTLSAKPRTKLTECHDEDPSAILFECSSQSDSNRVSTPG